MFMSSGAGAVISEGPHHSGNWERAMHSRFMDTPLTDLISRSKAPTVSPGLHTCLPFLDIPHQGGAQSNRRPGEDRPLCRTEG